MKNWLRIILIPIAITLSSHSAAYFLDVKGTHYDVTWVTASYNDIVAENPTAFTENVWWDDLYLAYEFSYNWARYGTETPGLLEFTWGVLDLRGIGDYCDAVDCVVTVASSYGDYFSDFTVTENYADVVWTYAFATVVPEPATLVLLAIGLAGLGVTRKTRV